LASDSLEPVQGGGRKRRTTTLVVMKKTAQVATFADVVVRPRRAISEPFLASWDYSAQHTYLSVQLSAEAEVEAAVRVEEEGVVTEEAEAVEEEETSRTTLSASGVWAMTGEAVGDDPVEFYSKLAGDEVRLENVDGRPVVVSGTFQGLFAALLTHLGTFSDHHVTIGPRLMVCCGVLGVVQETTHS
jgi:hypothetical protein